MPNQPVSLLITVPVYGQHQYTHALVQDLERDRADYVIVDNGGDYPAIGRERVIRPGRNLGWAGGSDLGFRLAFSEGYSHAMTLNNDTRTSPGFVDALLDRRLPDHAGIIGPTIDHGFPSAESDEKPRAADYSPRQVYREVPAVEGTALALSRECWQAIGGLDLHTFRRYGWGIDLDLALRAQTPASPWSSRRWLTSITSDTRQPTPISVDGATSTKRTSKRCVAYANCTAETGESVSRAGPGRRRYSARWMSARPLSPTLFRANRVPSLTRLAASLGSRHDRRHGSGVRGNL